MAFSEGPIVALSLRTESGGQKNHSSSTGETTHSSTTTGRRRGANHANPGGHGNGHYHLKNSVSPIALTMVLSMILIGIGKGLNRIYGQLLSFALLVSILGFIIAFLFLDYFGGAV